MFELKNRVAVITGASSGLGMQMAKAFAKQGASVVLMARRLQRLVKLRKELEKKGTKCLALACDVTDTDQINAAAKEVEKTFKRVDILVNCAGASKDFGVLDMTDEDWQFTIDTDLSSVFKVTRAFANIMKQTNNCY